MTLPRQYTIESGFFMPLLKLGYCKVIGSLNDDDEWKIKEEHKERFRTIQLAGMVMKQPANGKIELYTLAKRTFIVQDLNYPELHETSFDYVSTNVIITIKNADHALLHYPYEKEMYYVLSAAGNVIPISPIEEFKYATLI